MRVGGGSVSDFWESAITAFFGRHITSPIKSIDDIVALFAVSTSFIGTFTRPAIRLQESPRLTT
ncbi:hypothetical protein LBMAG13_19390 [Actinomycetes bacterium]|nr:hypothetical protein LBMAG13_19390 [Actinomycetes bacterium]